jgi:hypothetical protein
LGVLQARDDHNDTADPGSYGYLVQKLVIDALSVSKGARRLIERKDFIMRRFAFYLYKTGQDSATHHEFELIVRNYEQDQKVRVDATEILDDLLYGRVLDKIDENLSFKFKHYFHFFLARHFIDEIEKGNGTDIRQYLNDMADRPLVKSNHLTVIFFLFFRKQDELLDRMVSQANETLSSYSETDLLEDIGIGTMNDLEVEMSRVDENVDTAEIRMQRLAQQDQQEEKQKEREKSPETSLSGDISYSSNLPLALSMRFSITRLEMLGQVIRNFPDALDGEKKVRLLEAAFRLGLRTLKAVHEYFRQLEVIMTKTMLESGVKKDEIDYDAAADLLHNVIAFLVRISGTGFMVLISRAVGVADLEAAYAEAIARVGKTPATSLVNLAIKLDNSTGFPFKEVEAIKSEIPKKAKLPLLVMSDLVVRHTQIYPLKQETLRRIAGQIKVDSIELYKTSRN